MAKRKRRSIWGAIWDVPRKMAKHARRTNWGKRIKTTRSRRRKKRGGW